MILTGPEPTPRFVSLPAPVVRKIRTVSMFTGLGVITWSLVCGGLLLGLGHRLPIWYSPLTRLAVAVGLCSVFFLFLMGVGLVLTRRNLSGEQLNITGARSTLRAFLVLWGGTVLTSGLSVLLIVALVNSSSEFSSRPDVHFSAPLFGYLLLPISSAVLAGIGLLVSRRLLRPSPPLLRQG